MSRASTAAADRAASCSSSPRTCAASRISRSLSPRTRVPLYVRVSTSRSASSSRNASRTGPWLVSNSRAICNSTSRSPGRYSPDTIRSTNTRRICARMQSRRTSIHPLPHPPTFPTPHIIDN